MASQKRFSLKDFFSKNQHQKANFFENLKTEKAYHAASKAEKLASSLVNGACILHIEE
jgi:hypothetical protein